MKKSIRTIMAFLTAMTVVTGTMSVTAFAEKSDTSMVVSSENAIDGIFSAGAEYRLIEGTDTLVIDGEGSFTEEEFSELISELSPRAVVFGDSVIVPGSENADNKWLAGILEITAPYAVYAHRNSKINQNFIEMKALLKEKVIEAGLDPYEVNPRIYYYLGVLGDEADIYEDFTYDRVIIDRGIEMEKYLMEYDVREEIAREVVSYYMYGLNIRVQNGKESEEAEERANPDGTEINERTTNYIRNKCLRIAQSQQDLIDNANSDLTNKVSAFLAQNGIIGVENEQITIMCVNGGKGNLAFSGNNVQHEDGYQWTPYLPTDTSEETQTTEVKETAATEAVIAEKSQMETVAATGVAKKTEKPDGLIGDANGDGRLSYRDVAYIARAIAKGKWGELPEQADFNEDGIINTRDAYLIQMHLYEIGETDSEIIDVMWGDADLNGERGLADVITISKYTINSELFPFKNDVAFTNADMNGDDAVDSLDCNMLIEANLGN